MQLSRILFVSISVVLFSCKVVSVKPTTNMVNIQLWATYYYVPTLNHADKGIPLLDIDENELPLKLEVCDWCTAAAQGSVYIRKNERVYLAHYAGRSEVRQFDCRDCWMYRNYSGYDLTGKVRWTIDAGDVTGSSGLKLLAMKSIAVDPAIIPYRSVVFIPDAVGVIYSDEEGQLISHDGYFLAADTGSLINGNHIDVFLGTTIKNPFGFIKSDIDKSFQAFIVHEESRRAQLLAMHQ